MTKTVRYQNLPINRGFPTHAKIGPLPYNQSSLVFLIKMRPTMSSTYCVLQSTNTCTITTARCTIMPIQPALRNETRPKYAKLSQRERVGANIPNSARMNTCNDRFRLSLSSSRTNTQYSSKERMRNLERDDDIWQKKNDHPPNLQLADLKENTRLILPNR